MSVTFFVSAAIPENAEYDSEAYQAASFNVANANARAILDASGAELNYEEYAGELYVDLCGELTPEECYTAAANLLIGAQYVEPVTVEQMANGGRFINCGRSWDQLAHYAQRMQALGNLAQEFETVVNYG